METCDVGEPLTAATFSQTASRIGGASSGPRGVANPALTSPVVIQRAARLESSARGRTAVAVAAGTQRAADPRTGSTGHLLDNLAVEHVALDGGALRELAGVGA